jgi:hypothetical protein
MDFVDVFLGCDLIWAAWTQFIKNGRTTSPEIVEPTLDGRNRRRSIPIDGIQFFFDFFTRLPSLSKLEIESPNDIALSPFPKKSRTSSIQKAEQHKILDGIG